MYDFCKKNIRPWLNLVKKINFFSYIERTMIDNLIKKYFILI